MLKNFFRYTEQQDWIDCGVGIVIYFYDFIDYLFDNTEAQSGLVDASFPHPVFTERTFNFSKY
jgi:hypothetical protein